MREEETLVAIVSPWEKLADLVKKKFRVESLPDKKMVMGWRDDLQTNEKLAAELTKLGVAATEVTKRKPTDWKRMRSASED